MVVFEAGSKNKTKEEDESTWSQAWKRPEHLLLININTQRRTVVLLNAAISKRRLWLVRTVERRPRLTTGCHSNSPDVSSTRLPWIFLQSPQFSLYSQCDGTITQSLCVITWCIFLSLCLIYSSGAVFSQGPEPQQIAGAQQHFVFQTTASK